VLFAAAFQGTLTPVERARDHLRLLPSEQPPVTEEAGDRALVGAVRAGDRRAAVALYNRLRPRLDVTVRRLLGRRDVDHDDLVQDALIEIVRSIDAFRGSSTLETWAFTIAARVVYKHVRRRVADRRVFSPEASDPDDIPGASESRRIEARNLVGRVREHLAAIDEDKAWTFLLHEIMGFALQDVAQITGVTVAAAQTRLVRGRRELHERIAADPELADALSASEQESQ
jgi:RNA polymerase sigma-70 factor (ECF subfamily)